MTRGPATNNRNDRCSFTKPPNRPPYECRYIEAVRETARREECHLADRLLCESSCTLRTEVVRRSRPRPSISTARVHPVDIRGVDFVVSGFRQVNIQPPSLSAVFVAGCWRPSFGGVKSVAGAADGASKISFSRDSQRHHCWGFFYPEHLLVAT